MDANLSDTTTKHWSAHLARTMLWASAALASLHDAMRGPDLHMAGVRLAGAQRNIRGQTERGSWNIGSRIPDCLLRPLRSGASAGIMMLSGFLPGADFPLRRDCRIRKLSMKQPRIDSESLKHHFGYSWWCYVVFGLLLIAFWSIRYSATRYVPPAEKSIYVNFVGAYVPDALVEELTLKGEEAFPEMELIDIYCMLLDGNDSEAAYAAQQKLMVMTAAGEGDVYMIDRGMFLNYARIGLFEPLDAMIAEGGELNGLFSEEDIASCTLNLEEEGFGEHCFGLPADKFYTYYDYGVDPSRYVLTRTSYSKNPEYAERMLCLMAKHGLSGERPDWLDETAQAEEESRNETAQIAPIG